MALRWVIIGLWVLLLIARFVIVAIVPDADLTLFGAVEAGSIVIGLIAVAGGIWHTWATRYRRSEEVLGHAIQRFDPTAWLVRATPSTELERVVHAEHSDVHLGSRVTWGFGAIEASLWQLQGRSAVRLLVIPWRQVIHVAVEDLPGRAHGARVAMHYIRVDDSTTVATFEVRKGAGSMRALGRGARLEQIVADIQSERILG